MKKEYKKPVIVVESFALSEHIASICRVSGSGDEFRPNYRNERECAYIDDNLYLFYSAANECDMSLFKDATNPNIDELTVQCANVFSSTSTMFAS